MSKQDAIVFVLPTTRSGQRGPVAGWLNTSGWASAAEDLGFLSAVVTPEGVVDSDGLRVLASQPIHNPDSHQRFLAWVPTWLKVAIKDGREFIRARAFSRLVAETKLPDENMAFVWQRHELFHDAGLRLARRLGRPFVLYVVAPKVWEARVWGIRRPGWGGIVERFGEVPIFREADLVVCVSQEVSDVVQQFGVPAMRVLVSPSTVDTTLFSPSTDGANARQQLGLEGRFVIGWTGSFRKFHGLDLVLDGMRKIRDEIPEVLLLLVGDGPERARLAAKVEESGLAPWVRFVGTVRHNELPAILAACDVTVLLGRSDQTFHYSPLKLWEYLAMARPVVAVATGSPARMLTDGVNAVLVQPDDVDSLVHAIVGLRHDRPRRVELGIQARRLAERESWTHQLEKVCERIDQVNKRDRT